jgi:dTDP-4-amino-4,6-dideoxygalactose transaminase
MSEAIPLLDLEAQNGPLLPEIRDAIDRVVTSQQFILGPEVDALEREIEAALGLPHAIGVSSGTDALLVALMALGVGPGDEVISSPFSFFATAGCIARAGAKPVFVDVDPDSFEIEPGAVRAAVTERTAAILPVHLFGQPADVEGMRALGSPIIEDAAQAIGARVGDRPVGALGTVGCFSFFPSKNLGAFGDAGLVTTTDASLAAKIRVLRAHGAEPKYFHALIGGNFRLDAIQAAVLRVKLPHLARWERARRDNAALYDRLFAEAGLDPDVLRPPPRVREHHVVNQYVIRSTRRAALREHLASFGIGTAIYYPRPLHLQACFDYLGHREGDFPEAERACREALALPIFPELGEARIRRVARAVTSFLG